MAGLMGIKYRQKAFTVTTAAQNCLEETKIPRDVYLQNAHATAIVYVDLADTAGYYLPYTSGGVHAIVVGDVITGASGGGTGVVSAITVTSGSWAGGDAAGMIRYHTKTGNFQSENLNVVGDNNVATIAGDSDTSGLLKLAAAGGSLSLTNFRNAVSVMGSASNTLLTVLEGRS
jgi:hypothetical protein